MLEIAGLTKRFGEIRALDGCSLTLRRGQLLGFLGPNGAGKTTLLRLLCGLLEPSDGSVRIHGVDPRRRPSVYARVALVPEEAAVYGFQTARQFVTYAADLSGADRSGVDEAISSVALDDDADRPISEFSKGMRQRAKVAAALVGRPDVLVLDEPLNGTDPVQRAHLIEMFRTFAAEGRTVIVSSHVLAEVERMADRVLAIVDGKLAAAGDVAAIRSAMSDIPYRVRIGADEPRRLGARLLVGGHASSIEVDHGGLVVETTDLTDLGMAIPPLAQELDLRLTSFEPQDESLESVFRYLVRR